MIDTHWHLVGEITPSQQNRPPHSIQSHPRRIPCSFLHCATSTASICYPSNFILSNAVCYVLRLPADHLTRPQAAIGLWPPFCHSAVSLNQMLFATHCSLFIVHPAIGLWPPFCHVNRYFRYSSKAIFYLLLTNHRVCIPLLASGCHSAIPQTPFAISPNAISPNTVLLLSAGCSSVHHTRPAFGFCYPFATIWLLVKPLTN
jgi:hypothetical protein